MPWCFVGRTEQRDRIHRAFAERRPGPVVLLGEPGMGRTRLLAEALAPRPTDAVLTVTPAGPAPFAAVAPLLPPGFRPSLRTGIADAAAAVAAHAAGRRPVLVLDDAHQADQVSMQVLRQVHRTHDAVLVVTAASTGSLPPGPDPLDCLRYEPGTHTLRMPPLSANDVARVLADVLGAQVRPTTAAALHAATGGNPGLLRELVERTDLLGRTLVQDGARRLDPSRVADAAGVAEPVPLAEPAARRLTDAVAAAWRELALDRADDLCLLAAWRGLADRIATTWAGVLLLRGRPADGLRVLDTHADTSPRATVTRAMLIALGLRRIDDAETLLVDAARADVVHRERFLACRAWLLVATGASERAAAVLDGPGTEREAAVFGRAALAMVALGAGRATDAVCHLRRALVAVEGLRAELPWFPPYLTAYLIDALLLAGRINEATGAATDFHAGQHGCGWPVAVALDTLVGIRADTRMLITPNP